MDASPKPKPATTSASDTSKDSTPDETIYHRVAIGAVLLTAYVIATAASVRVVLLAPYDAMLEGLRIISDFLLEGGIFALIVHLIRRKIPDRAVDRFTRRSYDP